jgi:general secretion pathway protein L
VAFAGDARAADWMSFPVDRAAWARGVWRRFGNLALAALAGILVVAVLIAGLERGARANDALSDAVDNAQSRAAIVERMEHRIEAANKALGLLAAKRQEPLFVDSLARLSRLLPAGTWLTELHLEAGKFRADGYSINASALIAIIDKSGTFANVEFTAPLVRNQSDGTDRFELTFDAVPPKRRTP